MTACSHMAQTLMEMLICDDVKSISMGALQQINLDVIQCERKTLLTHSYAAILFTV